MRFLLLMWTEDRTTDEQQAAGFGTEADWQAWSDYETELRNASAYLAGGELQNSGSAKLVDTLLAGHARGTGVQSGTYPATDLQVGGFYLIETADEASALSWAERMPTYGRVEVRPVVDYDAT